MNKHYKSDLEALEFLLGRWKTEGKIAGETNGSFSGSDTYEWTLDKKFILHTVDVTMQGQHVAAIEMIGPPDPATGRYTMRSFDNQGIYTVMEAWLNEKGMLHINGETMRSTLHMIQPGRLKAHWEQKRGDHSWLPWMELTLSKEE